MVRPLVVSIDGDTKGLEAALGKAGNGISVFGKQVSTKAVVGVAAFAGVAGIAASALIDMTSAAAADRDESAKLASVIAAATGSTQDYTAATDAAIAAGQARAFSDSEVRAGLQPLVTATGDVTLATQQLAIAQDIARLANVDLATASEAVAKADQGQDKALRALIPGLTVGKDATETLANAQKLAAGQADKYGSSTAGVGARVSDAMGELGETIGSALLPILDALLPALLPLIDAFGEIIRALLPVLIPMIKVLAGVLKIVLGVVLQVVKAIASFISAVVEALQKIGELLRKVPLVGDLIGGGTQAVTAAVTAAPTVAGRSASSTATTAPRVQVNITGDPIAIEREVTRALQRYSRRNGTTIEGVTTTTFGRNLASVPGL